MPGEGEETRGQEEVKDEFGDAFEAASQEKTPEELEAEAQETGRAEGETGETDGKQPEGQADQGEAAGGEEPDYKKLYEEEHQKYSSLQGMYNQTQEENEQLKNTSPSSKKEPAAEGTQGAVNAEDLIKSLQLEDDDDVKLMLDEYDYLAKPLQKIVAKAMSLQNSGKQPSAEELTKQVLDIVSRHTHEQTIKAAHPDYDDLVASNEVQQFVEGLPDGEDKTRFTGYYQKGTADEVISLIGAYKESKGIKTQAGNAKDSKIRNLTAVKSRHTPIDVGKKTGKAQGYDDAFDEAVATGGKR